MDDKDLKQISVTVKAAILEAVPEMIRAAIELHEKHCDGKAVVLKHEELSKRVNTIEVSSARLVGYMIGAGVFGGGVVLSGVKVLGI